MFGICKKGYILSSLFECVNWHSLLNCLFKSVRNADVVKYQDERYNRFRSQVRILWCRRRKKKIEIKEEERKGKKQNEKQNLTDQIFNSKLGENE